MIVEALNVVGEDIDRGFTQHDVKYECHRKRGGALTSFVCALTALRTEKKVLEWRIDPRTGEEERRRVRGASSHVYYFTKEAFLIKDWLLSSALAKLDWEVVHSSSMAANVTLTRAQYDALIAAGLAGDSDEIKRLQALIDEANGINRYRLFIRWEDVGGIAPPTIELGKGWPPTQMFLLEKADLPIAREDVDVVVETQANNAVNVQVTPDVNGVVGWTLVDDFDFVAAAS